MECLLSRPISAVIAQLRVSYKGKRTVTHWLYHVSLQTGWMGQLKSKIGWLEISVYFTININCPWSVQWCKYWSQQWWHSIICYTYFSLWRPWNMMRVTLPASDDIFTAVVAAFLIKVSNSGLLEVNVHVNVSCIEWKLELRADSDAPASANVHRKVTAKFTVLLDSLHIFISNKCFQCCPSCFSHRMRISKISTMT